MKSLEHKYFGDTTTCQNQVDPINLSSNGSSLNLHSFSGLFIVTGVISIFSCLIYFIQLLIHRKFKSLPTTFLHTQSSIVSEVKETKETHFNNLDSDVGQNYLQNHLDLFIHQVVAPDAMVTAVAATTAVESSNSDQEDDNGSLDFGMFIYGGA